jgi:hypothetical protein
MKRKIVSVAIVLLLCISLMWPPMPMQACGPFFPQAIFTYTMHPDFPLDHFAAGELGIIQPSYARSYLFVAHRYLMGVGFSVAEQAKLVSLWKGRIETGWRGFDREDTVTAEKDWFRTRNRVENIPIFHVGQDYVSKDSNEYWNYIWFSPSRFDNAVNCLAPAFENAAKTLEDRIRRFGPANPVLKSWVSAQDAVFRLCHPTKRQTEIQFPEAAGSDLPEIIRADRDYQIAAAHFYALDFDNAGLLFAKISKDRKSPWRATATLMVARTIIRKTILESNERKDELSGLRKARTLLNQILLNKTLKEIHTGARNLKNFIDARIDPATRALALARTLAKAGSINLKSDLDDYTILLDHWLDPQDAPTPDAAEGPGQSEQKSLIAILPEKLRNDPLTDWVVSIQSKNADSRKHCVDRWQETRAINWLVAALIQSRAGDPQVGQLISAAKGVNSDSPAFLTVTFHRLRLEAQSGNIDLARTELDKFLAFKRKSLSLSAKNLFVALRLTLAKNLDEFVQFAIRTPAVISSDEYGEELPDDVSHIFHESRKIPTGAEKKGREEQEFDMDASWVLSRALPESMLVRVAMDNGLPSELRRSVAESAWVRAIVLGDEQKALQLAPIVAELEPKISSEIVSYISATDKDSRNFRGVLTILRVPGLRPIVPYGVGRIELITKVDQYRDNWWCHPEESSGWSDLHDPSDWPDHMTAFGEIYPNGHFESPTFLSADEVLTIVIELAHLRAIHTGTTWLAQQAIAWAYSHPNDSSVPEALHLAIRAMRYGCDEDRNDVLSKEAFNPLHRRYPNSEWTKKTPYWFK